MKKSINKFKEQKEVKLNEVRGGASAPSPTFILKWSGMFDGIKHNTDPKFRIRF